MNSMKHLRKINTTTCKAFEKPEEEEILTNFHFSSPYNPDTKIKGITSKENYRLISLMNIRKY